ncbi:hypothetical protein DICVIV_10743 [Dictyocaulus viviparus]|uniref:Uncharacterized protein n=1 Tax=Dictyocaulus viviparus TaxID=29172 RepID=A0A0D8XLK8_DICVI|nr:hypothetical protein DICVIV_10743 [Dictyocaulus viviparus]
MVSVLISLLLPLAFFRGVMVTKCYLGRNTANTVEVKQPFCGFRFHYADEDCRKKADIELYYIKHINSSMLINSTQKTDGKCYYDVGGKVLNCLCSGHLCNNKSGQKKILASYLARGTHREAQKFMTCYLLRNEAARLFILWLELPRC